MIARTTPLCPKCGGEIEGLYADKGENFVGDTFVCWNYEDHICDNGEEPTVTTEATNDHYAKLTPKEIEKLVKEGVELHYRYLEDMQSYQADVYRLELERDQYKKKLEDLKADYERLYNDYADRVHALQDVKNVLDRLLAKDLKSVVDYTKVIQKPPIVKWDL